MRELFTYKRSWLLMLAPFSYLVVLWARAFPNAVEKYYCAGLYRALSQVIARITGILPFSLAEALIICGTAAGAVWLFAGLFKSIAGRSRRAFIRLLAGLCMLAGLIPFVFTFTCGLNYYRPGFAAAAGLPVRPSTAQELALLLEELAESANELRALLPEDENGIAGSAYESPRQIAEAAAAAYTGLAEIYPVFSGYTPPPKPVFFSTGMSHLNLVGVFTSFTFEANINADIPSYSIPSAMLHELAHFKGFMDEGEANYIAWLCGRQSRDTELAYSGTLLAYTHTANALYAADRELYFETSEKLSPAVRRDFAARSAYWADFSGPAATVSTAVNDSYLKMNRQTDGVKSYGGMVDLLLAEYRLRHPDDK